MHAWNLFRRDGDLGHPFDAPGLAWRHHVDVTHDQINDHFAAVLLLDLAVRASGNIVPVRAARLRVGDDHAMAGADDSAVIPDAPAGRTRLARSLRPDGAEVEVEIVGCGH